MKPANRADTTGLEDVPNVGPSIAGVFGGIGIHSPKDLAGKDPDTMYDDLCDTTGVRRPLRDRRFHRRRPFHGR